METGAIVCLSFAVALLAFSVSRRIRARVILSQIRAAVIQDPIKLGKQFYCIAYYLIAAGVVCIAVWLLPLWYSKSPSGYWLTGGITLWAVAGTLVAQGKELTTKNQKEFGQKEYGQKIYATSKWLIAFAVALLIVGIILHIWAYWLSLHG